MRGVPDDSRKTSAALINRVKDLTDDAGWREFVSQYRRLILSVALQHGLTDSEAEEARQEVFIRVARKIGVFETGGRTGSFRRWLGQLTRWCAEDVRRRNRFPTVSLEPDAESEAPSEAQLVADPHVQDPCRQVTDDDFIQLLLRRLRQLVSAKDYEVYELLSFQGWTPERVAEHLGLRRGNVDTILSRVRKIAREELERLGEEL